MFRRISLVPVMGVLVGMGLPALPAVSACSQRFQRMAPPLVLQKTDYTCGAACLVSIVKAMKGKELAEHHVAAIIGTNRSIGTTPEKIAKGLGLLGIPARLVPRLGLRELLAHHRRGGHALLLVQSEDTAHWVVLAGVEKDKIVLMDPWHENTGYQIYSQEEFLSLWDTIFMGKKVRQLGILVD